MSEYVLTGWSINHEASAIRAQLQALDAGPKDRLNRFIGCRIFCPCGRQPARVMKTQPSEVVVAQRCHGLKTHPLTRGPSSPQRWDPINGVAAEKWRIAPDAFTVWRTVPINNPAETAKLGGYDNPAVAVIPCHCGNMRFEQIDKLVAAIDGREKFTLR